MRFQSRPSLIKLVKYIQTVLILFYTGRERITIISVHAFRPDLIGLTADNIVTRLSHCLVYGYLCHLATFQAIQCLTRISGAYLVFYIHVF